MRCRVPIDTTPGSAFFSGYGGVHLRGKASGLGRKKRSRDLSYKGETGKGPSYVANQIQRSCVNSSVCVTNSG
jgi:hypothetical protein